MEWGNYAKQLEAMEKRGRKISALQNKPELFDDLVPVWQAFNQLHSGRQGGLGINPLRTSDIIQYLNWQEFDADCFDLILAMDNEWCKWASDKHKQEQEAKKKKGGK